MKYTILMACMAAMTILSCSKKEDKKGDASVVGKWKVTSVTSSVPIDRNGTGTKTTDLFSGDKDCDKDDIYVFYATGNYEVNEGATQCKSSAPFIHTEGAWSMKENTITIAIDGEFINSTVLQLDDKTLKTSNETDWFGQPYVATYTFQRQ